ncbi:MAG: hypothetical protein IPI21_04040 [Propionivibrio sp.]|nr:hypothetical protein [Propionivibrio sp.]
MPIRKACSGAATPTAVFRLVRLQADLVVVTNVDPMSLDNQARYELNGENQAQSGRLRLSGRQAGWSRRPFPIRGAIKLRSMLQMLAFVASGARAVPEFDVAPDPRTGAVSENPRSALHIDISRFRRLRPSPRSSLKARLRSVGNTTWDRANFATPATSSTPLSVTSRGSTCRSRFRSEGEHLHRPADPDQSQALPVTSIRLASVQW